MSKRHSEKSGASVSELNAKKIFRQIWECGQKVESTSRSVRHTIDLFQPELKSLRERLHEKCARLLLIRSSYSRKAEELLWKRGFYDVIQRCKQRSEAVDGQSPLWQLYSQHIAHALGFYNHLLHKMQSHFGVDSSQLNVSTPDGSSLHWLQDVMYKCFIHLGDLARYQVSLGGDVATAVAYYHKAITLDPTNGTAFNQLAVLVSGRNDHLDSIYYYQRSIVSAQPFSGSEANMLSLFDKSRQTLENLEARFIRTTNPDTREMTKRLLFLRFIEVQHALYPGNKTTAGSNNTLSKLCEETLESLKQCLENNLEALKENSDKKMACILSGKSHSVAESDIVLQPDVLLKLTALSILPSYSLRQLGSTLTPVATAFALSVFSQLLSYSFQCIAQLVMSAIRVKYKSESKETPSTVPGESDIMNSLERGKSIASILLENSVSAIVVQPAESKPKQGPVSTCTMQNKASVPTSSSAARNIPSKQKKKVRVVDRRRRRRGSEKERISSGEDSNSDESDEDSLSSSGSLGRLSSDEELPLENLGEDDLELLDSLSESSSSDPEEEEEGVSKPRHSAAGDGANSSTSGAMPASAKRAGRKHIILAANFNMPPKTTSPSAAQKDKEDKGVISKSGVTGLLPRSPQQSPDSQLMELIENTAVQSSVYTACRLLAEESSLMALKVFTHWLHSFPIIIATCTQSSGTMWSRIASLLNVIPTQQDIVSSNVAGCDVGEGKWPLLEDHILRGFPPISPALQALQFGGSGDNTLSVIQEISYRVYSLQSFGNFLADARTAPSFMYDHALGKFEGPSQKSVKEQDIARATEEEDRKQAEVKRSKLMKAMAHQRLKTEVSTLAQATSKTDGVIFTPYLIPDANSLCTGLHLVKKLLKTEKFIFIIAKAVIELLDNMKKGRESYAAREAIKFLEKELHSGNKFIQAQKASESLQPGKKKPGKMDIQDWHFECLVDCACYFNRTNTHMGQTHAVTTLLVEKSILDVLNDSTKQAENSHIAEMLMTAQQNGVDLETMIGFHINWSKNSKRMKTPSV